MGDLHAQWVAFGTHLLIIAEVKNQSHALQLVLPKTLLQTFVDRLCPKPSVYLRKVVGRRSRLVSSPELG